MLLVGVLKILGDMLAFIGPLAVGSVTLYVETIQVPTTDAQVGRPQCDCIVKNQMLAPTKI